MAITSELRGVVSACVRAIFRDSARQLVSTETRVAYSLSSTVKWEEIVRVERALREQPLRSCLMSKDGSVHLVFIQSSDNHAPYAPPKLLVRAIRGMLRETLKELSEEQRTSMLSLTMRVQGLRSTDGGVMTEGVSFKSNVDSVTLVCRFGTNRLLDLSRITAIFASYTVDGLLTSSSTADVETRGGISPEGQVCSKAGLLPLVLYAQVAHESLRPPPSITGKRVQAITLATQQRKEMTKEVTKEMTKEVTTGEMKKRKRVFFGVFGF